MNIIGRTVLAILLMAAGPAVFAQSLAFTITPPSVKAVAYDSQSKTVAKQVASFTISLAANPSYNIVFLSATWYVNGNEVANAQSDSESFAVGVGDNAISADVMFTANGTLEWADYSTEAIAFGGPLSVGIVPGSAATEVPMHDSGPTPTPQTAKPFYLQYFGYDPTQGTKGDNTQIPQVGTATAAPGQPAGTTCSWSAVGPLSFEGGTQAPTGATVIFAANTASSFAGCRVICTYTYANPSLSLAAATQDDSASTPPPGFTAPNYTYYYFTSHEPATVYTTPPPDDGSLWTPGSASINVNFTNVLYDTAYAVMPGVWVNERWPDGSSGPFGSLNVNSNLQYWTTGTGGVFGTETANGWSARTDDLSFSGGWSYEADSTPVLGPIHQEYCAATISVSSLDYGVLVRTFTDSFWCDRIIHQ